ncbi:nucleotidyl transferase AbiEii/AbiGii toxin family protein [Novosphingobium sp. BL-52-GroH]|uniref:nucleotidyl transferase AbiEii/AbiGii toxin family protein n=1 Tax=Novosphingobium sp. BL-52-GroH TaxID=3349877 RepID=UPI00384C44D7
MAKAPVNLAKSVKDRLLNIARKEGRAFDVVLVRFALERLLYRLSVTEHRDRFVLKGGMLVTVWIEDDSRVTRDADFLGHGDPDPDRLIADFRQIMAVEGDDGLVFDLDALSAEVIREDGIWRCPPQDRRLSTVPPRLRLSCTAIRHMQWH